MYHVGRPGRGRLHRARAAGVGRGRPQLPHERLLGSAGARATPSGWASTGRRPTTPTREVILLISAHLETGHYFNPHAQRIIEGKATRREAHRHRPAPVQHRRPGRRLAARLAGHRGGAAAGDRPPPARRGPLRPRVRARAGSTGRRPARSRAPGARPTFERFVARARAALRPLHARVRRARDAASRRPRSSTVAARGRRAPARRLASHNWRASAAGNLGGWQTARCLFFLNVLTGSVGHARRHRARTPGTSSCPRRPYMPPRPEHVERAALAARVPARVLRDVASCCRTSCSRAAARSTSTSPASTTRSGRTRTASPGWRCCATRTSSGSTPR